jgi:hypothetical protein
MLENSKNSSPRPSDKGSVKIEKLGWLELATWGRGRNDFLDYLDGY